MSEVEGCARWFVGGSVTLLVPHSAHEAPRRQRGLPHRSYPLPFAGFRRSVRVNLDEIIRSVGGDYHATHHSAESARSRKHSVEEGSNCPSGACLKH